MKISPKVQTALIWLGCIAIWTLVVVFSEWKLFPCQTFVFDSDQGYFFDFCPLRDDRDHWVFFQDLSYFSGSPNALTWPGAIGILIVLPLLPALLIHWVYQRVSFKPKA